MSRNDELSWKRVLEYEPGNTLETLKKKHKRLAKQLAKQLARPALQHRGSAAANVQRLADAWGRAQKALDTGDRRVLVRVSSIGGGKTIRLPQRLLTVRRVYELFSDWLNNGSRFTLVIGTYTSWSWSWGQRRMVLGPQGVTDDVGYMTFGMNAIVDTTHWGKADANGDVFVVGDGPGMHDPAMFGVRLLYDPARKRFVNPATNKAAATKIQAAWRGKKARNLAEHLRYAPGGTGFQTARANWILQQAARQATGNRR